MELEAIEVLQPKNGASRVLVTYEPDLIIVGRKKRAKMSFSYLRRRPWQCGTTFPWHYWQHITAPTHAEAEGVTKSLAVGWGGIGGKEG